MGEKQEAYEKWVMEYIERNILTEDARVGIRSALFDAAHLCDAIASDIEAGARKSKHRDELISIAKRCGDEIWALRLKVESQEAAGRTALETQP